MTLTSSVHTLFSSLTRQKELFHHSKTRRPFVTLSFAQTADGCLSTTSSERLYISHAAALRVTHQLRADHSGILVGVETVITDNPQLTVRHVPGNNPLRIVLDTNLRIPDTSSLLHDKCGHVLLASDQNAPIDKLQKFETLGAQVLTFPCENGIPLPLLLHKLFDLGIRDLIVEGGGQVISSFLAHGFVDFMTVTMGKFFIGNEQAVRYRVTEPISLEGFNAISLEENILFWGSPRPVQLAPENSVTERHYASI